MNKHIQPHVGIMKLFFQINDVWRQPTDFFCWLAKASCFAPATSFVSNKICNRVSLWSQASSVLKGLIQILVQPDCFLSSREAKGNC